MLRQETVIAEKVYDVSLWVEVGYGEGRTEDPWVYTRVAGTDILQSNIRSEDCL